MKCRHLRCLYGIALQIKMFDINNGSGKYCLIIIQSKTTRYVLFSTFTDTDECLPPPRQT